MVDKIKQENDNLRLVHNKHLSIITRKSLDYIKTLLSPHTYIQCCAKYLQWHPRMSIYSVPLIILKITRKSKVYTIHTNSL